MELHCQLFCLGLLSFVSVFWRKVHTQTIESVDEETIEAYVSSYQQLLADNNQLVDQVSTLDLEQFLKDPLVDNYFGNLLQEIKLKQ